MKSQKGSKKLRSKVSSVRPHVKKCCHSSVIEDSDDNLVVSGSLISIHVNGVKNNLRPVFLVLDEKKSLPSEQLVVSSDLQSKKSELAVKAVEKKEGNLYTNKENTSTKYHTLSSDDFEEPHESLKKGIGDKIKTKLKSDGKHEKIRPRSKQGKKHIESECSESLYEDEIRRWKPESNDRNGSGNIHIRNQHRSTTRSRPASAQEKSRSEREHIFSRLEPEHRYIQVGTVQRSEHRTIRSDNEHKSNRPRSDHRKIRSDNEHRSMRPGSEHRKSHLESGYKCRDFKSCPRRRVSSRDHRESRSRNKREIINSDSKYIVCPPYRTRPLSEHGNRPENNLGKSQRESETRRTRPESEPRTRNPESNGMTKRRGARYKTTQQEKEHLTSNNHLNIISEDLKNSDKKHDLSNLDKLVHVNSPDDNLVIECKTHSSSVQ